VPRGWRSVARAVALVVSVAGCVAASSGVALAPELVAKARAQGGVSVIVGLRVPEGAGAAVIAAAQDALAAELASVPHRIGRRYSTIPFMSLVASEEALRVLAASPNVVSISEDRKLSPLAPAPPVR
jgi:hypothetical protein